MGYILGYIPGYQGYICIRAEHCDLYEKNHLPYSHPYSMVYNQLAIKCAIIIAYRHQLIVATILIYSSYTPSL